VSCVRPGHRNAIIPDSREGELPKASSSVVFTSVMPAETPRSSSSSRSLRAGLLPYPLMAIWASAAKTEQHTDIRRAPANALRSPGGVDHD
jgi:hypothetical protein